MPLPPTKSNDTLLDHCLWVVVLDALDLMIPLLQWHFSLPGSGIATKGVNSRSTHPQPGCEHAEEAVDICVSPSGTCRLLGGLAWSPSLPHGRSLPFHPLQLCCCPRNPWTTLGSPLERWSPPSLLSPCGECWAPSRVDQGEVPYYPK